MTDITVKLVIQSLVLSHLHYCSIIWSGESKQELVKFQLTQNRTARHALHCSTRSNVEEVHARLSRMRVDERLAYSLIVFLKNVNFYSAASQERQTLYLLIHYIN